MSSNKKASQLPIIIKKPANMERAELEVFEKLVVEGGEIDPLNLGPRLESAEYLGYAIDSGKMIAVGAIKNPTLRHKSDIARKSGIDLSNFKKELGYLFVRPSHQNQHLATRIAKELLDKVDGPIFATTRIDNYHSIRLLEKQNFMNEGQPWFSQRRTPSRQGIRLCLWVKNKPANRKSS